MSIPDYLLNGALVALVILQIRGKRLTAKTLLLPVLAVVVVGHSYLHGFPTAGNDLYLSLGGPLLGLLLGVGAGIFTSVKPDGRGIPLAKAGFTAAALWIVGVGGRMAFEVYATHGGGSAIAHFSATHAITTAAAWTTGLVLMALVEVVSRTAVLAWKGYGRQLIDGLAKGPAFGSEPATSGIMANRGRTL